MLNPSMQPGTQYGANTPKSDKIQKLREKMLLAQKTYSYQNIDENMKEPILGTIISSPIPGRLSFVPSSHNDSFSNQGDFFPNNLSSVSNNNSLQNLNKGDYNINEIVPKNDKEKRLKDILTRLNTYRCNWQNIKRIFASVETKVQLKNPLYFDYLNERDDLNLKILIQILYEEIDDMSNFLEQTSVTQKECIENLEKKIKEKDIICTKLAEEMVAQKINGEKLQEKLNSLYVESENQSNYLNELSGVLQTALDEIAGPILSFNEEKKKRLIEMIQAILFKMPKLLTKKEFISSISDVEVINTPNSECSNGITFNRKREMTFADLMDVLNKEGIILNDLPDTNNYGSRNSHLKVPSEYIQGIRSPQSALKRESKWFSPDRKNEINHKKSVSFQEKNDQNLSEEEQIPIRLSIPNQEKSENQKSSSDLMNLNIQLQQKVHQLQMDLSQAEKSISHLLEEKETSQTMIQRLKLQKGELINKLQMNGADDRFQALFTSTCESPNVGFDSTINKSLTLDESIKAGAKGTIDTLKEDEDKTVLVGRRISRDTKESPSIEYQQKSLTLSRLIQSILSKLKDGSELSEEEKNILTTNFTSEFVNIIQDLRARLKRYEEIIKILMNQYENKILDSIEKYEDLKGICNLILITAETVDQTKNDNSPVQWRAIKTDFERKRGIIQKKVKDIEQEQEKSRTELQKLLEEEKYLNEVYGNVQEPNLDQKANNEYNILKQENQELNEMVKTLATEISSLKSQIRLVNTAEEHRKNSNQSYPELRLSSKQKFTPQSSFCVIDDEEKPKISYLVNQNDLFYMLGAQASALEALL